MLREYAEEVCFAIDIGVIIKCKDDKDYIQLHKEVWSMFNKDTFNKSDNEQVVITPDSEVFI